MLHSFPRLYARAKTGKVKWWEISVYGQADGTGLIAITHAAGLEAKPTTTQEHITKGKNLGKANATTALQQAINEAESRWKKQLDKGYSETVPAEDTAHNTNTLGLPQPMLALSIEKVTGPMPERVFVQPKLDGHRCLAARVDGKVVMWSRNGKLIETMSHIAEHLQGLIANEAAVLDGELYIHGMPLQEIGSLIKRKQEDSARVEYHVYDILMRGGPPAPFSARAAWLTSINRPGSPVKSVMTFHVPYADVSDYFLTFRAQGYEGAMVRHPEGLYEPGYRSTKLLKVKQFQDAEYEVVGIKAGTPKSVNGQTLQVAVLDCGAFTVTAPGTAEDKHNIYHNRHDFIGRKVTVKFAYLTKEGVPFHPVAVRFRDDI